MKPSLAYPVILSASFIWAKNPDLHSLNSIKTGFFAALRMTDTEGFFANGVAE